MKKYWLLIDSSEGIGFDSILGIFETETEAKVYLADYLIETQTTTDDIELEEIPIPYIASVK